MSGLVENVEHFQHRVIQDALREATAGYWRGRAAILEWARPRPGDWHGAATREDLRGRYDQLTEQAEACRSRARVAELGGEEW